MVAVPDVWLDVDTMADLDDVAADFRQRHGRRLRIATKYWRLTQQFFSQKHGIQVYRIVESLGATEGAPAAGLADVIVDITTTGSTLRANHLKVLADGVILKSQACLVASRKARGAADKAVIAELAERLAKAAIPSPLGEVAAKADGAWVVAESARMTRHLRSCSAAAARSRKAPPNLFPPTPRADRLRRGHGRTCDGDQSAGAR